MAYWEGYQNVLFTIIEDLHKALATNSKPAKNELINRALGSARALYKISEVTDDADDNKDTSTF